jgi:glycolate oxidase iron-sulfur subunit
MQTNFTPGQLADPDMRTSEAVIRRCVHCGFCTATCPTYVLLGDELDSPRGRIYLMKEMLEAEAVPTPDVVKHVDRCLSCLACETTCPSGVSYRRLVDHARNYIEQRYRRPLPERLLREMLARVLPYRGRFKAALAAAAVARPLGPIFRKLPGLKSLGEMLAFARPGPPPAKGTDEPLPAPTRRVAMLRGCVEPVMGTSIQPAAKRLLRRVGCEVVRAPGEGCCGALLHHLGREEQGLEMVRANVDAWWRLIGEDGLDAIIVTASGCGTVIKDYGYLLREDPAYAERAAKISGLARDISEWIAECGLPQPVCDVSALTVGYHPACSLQHGQKLRDVPARLLRDCGFQVRMPADAHLCCGSAGVYNILQPKIAGQLGQRKANSLEALKPDVIAAGNIGCLAQIDRYAEVPLVHTVELLDWATGGPRPPALTR